MPPNPQPLGLGLSPYKATQLLTTTSLALLLGSTTWASVAVMPSLIAAPISTYAKLSVFRGLIIRANSILPPVFIATVAGLGYLANTAFSGGARGNYAMAMAAVLAALGLQVKVLPLNKAMVEVVDQGRGKEDQGEEGNRRIGELLVLNWGRVALSAVAFGLSLWELGVVRRAVVVAMTPAPVSRGLFGRAG